jgi:hypothetical protein
MFKHIFGAALLMLATSMAMAQTAPTPRADAHKSYDDKIRECRKLGAEQGLTGEALRAYVTDCARR